MTRYAVRDGLSFCRIGEHFVFLDIDSDRYFQLSNSMDRTLTTYLDGGGASDLDLSGLVERNILVAQKDTATGSRRRIRPAARSAMEAPLSAKHLRLSELLEVLAVVLWTRMALKLSTLKVVLGGLGDDRHTRPTQTTLPKAKHEQRLSDAAAAFRRARLYVPVDMCCLLDSIAMAKFLHKRQLHAHVVFGVAFDPFSAHCWVQADDLVLNDTVGNVQSHTPIRVV